jgi:1-acyl-sn-glycerol-3-phosphate acyltransferase
VKSTPSPSPGLQQFLGTDAGRAFLSAIAGYFHATLEGGENIPRSEGALLVSNHALFALDAAVLGALLIRDYARFPRFLGDRNLWRIPALRELITAIGALPGDPSAAQALLRQGELVIVYPGGVDDSLKLSSQRYQLQWKTRAGFARVAMAAQVPIVPVVGYGIDEMYTVLAREHWIGRRVFGSDRYDLPIGFGAFGTVLPRRSVQKYVALPPIDTHGSPDSAEDVERVRAATYQAIDSRLRLVREAEARSE